MARASRAESVSTLERAGADRVVSPYALSGGRMAVLSTRPAVVDFIDMVTIAPNLRLEEIHVRPGSALDGATVDEATSRHTSATVLAVRKASAELVPSPDGSTRLDAGDLVVAMGDEEAARVAGRLAHHACTSTAVRDARRFRRAPGATPG